MPKVLEGVEIDTEIDVYIDSVENENGMMVLSKNRADIIRAWQDISQMAKNQQVVEGVVLAKIKGGLHVDIGGVKAFLPGSQIELRAVKDLDQYVGNTYSFKIIRFNQKRGNIVLSRRVLLEEERENLRSQALGDIEQGVVLDGVVKNITDYGAFLDLGGVDGLLHIADISWSRVHHPSDKISIGQKLKVKVLKFNREKNRISLGLKQLHEGENPWEKIKDEIKVGEELTGTVSNLTDYGAFVSIKEGVEGLVHVSEMSWGKKIKHPSELLKTGDKIKLKVIDVDIEHQRISFSMKRLQENPWEKWINKYPKGTSIEGVVKSVMDFGIFVEIEAGLEGFIHVSDMSWSSRPNTKLKYTTGEKVKCVVLSFSMEEEKFQLGVKQLQKNPWEQVESLYPIGSIHKVKVVKIVDFGAFVELGTKGVEGLIHISELSDSRVEKVEDVLKMGDEIEAEIITMDKPSQKIGLSVKMAKMRNTPATSDTEKSTTEVKKDSPSDSKPKEGFFAKALKASFIKSRQEPKEPTKSADSSEES